jgi:hypothetical protein
LIQLLASVSLGVPLIARAAESPAVSPLKYEPPISLTANVCDATGTNILFKFKRTATRDGTNLNVLREFTAPDGTLVSRERIVYAGDKLVSFTLDELQTGASGTARIMRDPKNPESGKIEFSYQVRTGRVDKATESLRSDTLNGDMVGPFLADHWSELIKGREVKCRYLMVPRKETVGFSFSKHTESTWQGRPVVVVRMAPSSMLIGLLVDPLYFILEKDGAHRVLQYTGRTTPKLKTKSGWKDLDGVTIFNWN